MLQQMALIFLLILTGFVLYRKQIISEHASKDLSALVVNICSPGLIIVSMFEDLSSVSRDSVFFVGMIGICFSVFKCFGTAVCKNTQSFCAGKGILYTHDRIRQSGIYRNSGSVGNYWARIHGICDCVQFFV